MPGEPASGFQRTNPFRYERLAGNPRRGASPSRGVAAAALHRRGPPGSPCHPGPVARGDRGPRHAASSASGWLELLWPPPILRARGTGCTRCWRAEPEPTPGGGSGRSCGERCGDRRRDASPPATTPSEYHGPEGPGSTRCERRAGGHRTSSKRAVASKPSIPASLEPPALRATRGRRYRRVALRAAYRARAAGCSWIAAVLRRAARVKLIYDAMHGAGCRRARCVCCEGLGLLRCACCAAEPDPGFGGSGSRPVPTAPAGAELREVRRPA